MDLDRLVSSTCHKSNFFLTSPGSHTANENWLDFKQTLAATVKINIPSKISKGGARHSPWLNAAVRHHI